MPPPAWAFSQPPLSQQIRRLEDKIGHPLFTRQPGRLSLTPVGEGQAGSLRIGFAASLALTVLPALLRRFRTRYPGVRLHIQEMTTAPQMAALHDRSLDVGLLREPSDDSAELEFKTVLTEPYVAVLPKGHPAASSRRVPVADLADSPFVLLPRHAGPQFHDQIVSLCAAAGFTPHVAQHAVEWQTVCALVEAGLGVSLAPASVRRIRLEGVAFRALESCDVRTRVAVGWHRGNPNPLIAQLTSLLDEDPSDMV